MWLAARESFIACVGTCIMRSHVVHTLIYVYIHCFVLVNKQQERGSVIEEERAILSVVVLYEIWGSHSIEDISAGLQGYTAMWILR
jgi:hypothetical protein